MAPAALPPNGRNSRATEVDGCCGWEPNGLTVSHEGRWLIRTIAAVFRSPAAPNGQRFHGLVLAACFRLNAKSSHAGG